MNIKITPVNLTAEKKLQALLSKVTNPEPLYKKIAGELENAIAENFSAGGRPSWLPLSKETLKRRKKRSGPHPIKPLVLSGDLRRSITSRHSNQEAVVGTNLIYAPTHQFGADIFIGSRSEKFIRSRYKRGVKKGKFKKMKSYTMGKGFTFKSHVIHVPARPFLQLTTEDISQISQIITNHYQI
jgi:phage virion morphogenesis protein